MTVMSSGIPWQQLAGMVGDFEPGGVALVGAGPGDRALICVRGAVRLMQADVVLYDASAAATDLLELVDPQAERVCVDPPAQEAWSQEEINAALVRYARAGKRVVRLVTGDPFVAGRCVKECVHLIAARVRCEVVPGMPVEIGVSASTGIPLTQQGVSRLVAIAGEPVEPDAWAEADFAALAGMPTVVLAVAGLDGLDRCCERLIDAGMDARMPAAAVSRPARPAQQTIVGTVGDIAGRVSGEQIEGPLVLLIGQAVRLRETAEWFERRPLYGQTVAVTRMPDQSAALRAALEVLGAEVIETSTIELAEVDDYYAVDQALRRIREYDWLVLTSASGAAATFARLEAMGLDSRALAGPRIAAIGSATAARLMEHGVRPDLVPNEAVGEALAQAIIQRGVAGRRVLLLRSDIARSHLVEALAGAGAACDDLAVYRTVCPQSLPAEFVERIDAGRIDWLTLTSPSSLVNLLQLLGKDRLQKLRRVKLASIGPVTTRAIRESGLAEAVEANPHDLPALVAAIVGAMPCR